MSVTQTHTHEHLSGGGRLVAPDGTVLPLRGTRLRVEAGGGIARARLEQTFHNPHREPLTVTYQLPLPADGAVAGYAFAIGDRRIQGEIDKRRAARERFEEAMSRGHSAALLEQDRSSLFTQQIGNAPPGCDVVAEIEVDQPLTWIDGGWEWRFPTAVAPRYLGEAGRVSDAGRVTVDVAEQPLPPRLAFDVVIRDVLVESSAPTSPSHRIMAQRDGEHVEVTMAAEDGARLDRDVVVRWSVARPEVGAAVETARTAGESAHGLLTIVPPAALVDAAVVGRDVVLLIDTSGSMGGAPIAQAKEVVSAIVRSLGERDQLEMIEFSSRPRRWKRHPARATSAHRADALHWIEQLRAGGATEMRRAISEALAPLGAESQRQVVLVTDGLIGFETEIVAEILRGLPPSSRVHTLGIGSAVNRSLLTPAARAGRGVEAILGVDEDPEPAAQRLVARMQAPLVVDLALTGTAVIDGAPACLPDLFAGAPARVALRLKPEGGEVVVRGRTATGTFERAVAVPPTECGAGRAEVVALYGRERVEDLETRVAAGESRAKLDTKIEALGLEYRLATRLTSWIAVSSEPTVDPTQPVRHERVPHELPYGMSVEGLGLRTAVPGAEFMDFMKAGPAGAMMTGAVALDEAALDDAPLYAEPRRKKGRFFGLGRAQPPMPPRPVWRGRIVLHRDGVLVIEIEAANLDWEVPTKVVLHWHQGAKIAGVDADRTTAAGMLGAGMVARLTLNLDHGEFDGEPVRVILATTGGKHIVELS